MTTDPIRAVLKDLIVCAEPFTSGDTVVETSGTIPLMEALDKKIGEAQAALAAPVEAAQQREDSKDAEDANRYRWLRDCSNWTVTCANDVARFSARIPVPTKMLANDTANELDTAIDAAIAATSKEKT